MNKHKKHNDLIKEFEMIASEDVGRRMNHNELYNPAN